MTKSSAILPPASCYPPAPIELKINDTVLGTLVTMTEWIGNELARLQNNVRPRHCEHYSELVALIEDPKLFDALNAPHPPLPPMPPMFMNQDDDDDDEEDDDMDTNDDYEDEDLEQDHDDEEDEEDNKQDNVNMKMGLDQDTMQGIIHNNNNESDNIPAAADDATATTIITTTTTTTTTTTNHINNTIPITTTTKNLNIKKHIKPLPPTWLCRVFIEIMRYCGRISATINAPPRLLLTEFNKLRLDIKLGKVVNANEFRERLLSILFGKIQMTEHLVKCWKLMCEWVTRAPLNNHQNAMKWIEISVSAYIAAQRLVIGEYLISRKQQQEQQQQENKKKPDLKIATDVKKITEMMIYKK